MAQQRGRGSRRGGGYSSRQQGGRQPGRAQGGRPGPGARNGYGPRGGGGGASGVTIALVAALVGGGLIAILLIVLLLGRSDSSDQGQPVPARTPAANPAPFGPAAAGEVEKPLEPLTSAQVKEIDTEIRRIAGREAEVRRLEREGFEAQDRGDTAEAQRCWGKASDMLHGMMVEANEIFIRVGGDDDGEERAERFAPNANRTFGVWSKLRAEISRYVK